MNQFDGFRDDSDCSRKVHFTYFYRTHGVEQSSSDAGSYAHTLLFPQDHKATFNKTLMITEANVGEVKAYVREIIAELGEELLLRNGKRTAINLSDIEAEDGTLRRLVEVAFPSFVLREHFVERTAARHPDLAVALLHVHLVRDIGAPFKMINYLKGAPIVFKESASGACTGETKPRWAPPKKPPNCRVLLTLYLPVPLSCALLTYLCTNNANRSRQHDWGVPHTQTGDQCQTR
jgi:hypothetical protein